MNNNYLISNYSFSNQKHKNIYSAGPDIFFNKPCIGYVKKGYAKFLYNGSAIYAKAGDLIYIAFETRYQSIWYGSPDIEWYSINFDFQSKYAFYDYRFQIIPNYPPEIFEKMYNNYDNSPMLSVSYFYQLLDDIYSKMHRCASAKYSTALKTSMDYIYNNYSKEISIKELEEISHTSKSTIFNQFKKSLGVTPVAYKHNIMIQHAINLLSSTDLSVEEISSRVGFSSSNYFRKIFKEITDKTPNELRKHRL